MNSAHDWLLATPLLVSLISIGTAGASELEDSAQHPGAAGGLAAEHSIEFSARRPIGLTARLEAVATFVADAPRRGDADEWIRRPREDGTAAQEEGAGWMVGGALIGALMVGVPMGAAAQALQGSAGVGIAVGLAGGLAGGVCGHYLGRFARDESSGAGSRSATLTVLNVVVRIAAVALAATLKLNLSPVGLN